MTTELVNENYHGKDKIKRRYDQIFEKWRLLLDLLDKRRRVLDVFGDLVQMIRDADSMYADLKNMEVRTNFCCSHCVRFPPDV